MAFSDFWRGEREKAERDRNRWRLASRQRGEQRFRQDYDAQDEEFARRQWRQDAEDYPHGPERYGARGYGEDAYAEQDYGAAAGRGDPGQRRHMDYSDDWRRPRSSLALEHAGLAGYGPSRSPWANDRWEESYGPNAGRGSFGATGSFHDTGRLDSGRSRYDPLMGQQGTWPHPKRYLEQGDPYGFFRHSGSAYGEGDAGHGSYRGLGPRGYRRSDERIREDACECLTQDDRIDASHVDVTVKDGEVTLSGTVGTREQKRRTEDLVEQLSGITDVHNHLKVQRERRSGEETQGRGAASSEAGQAAPQTDQTSRH